MSNSSKMYICVRDDVPDFIVPTLVGHAVLGYHIENAVEWGSLCGSTPNKFEFLYDDWLENSFKKCVVKVNQKEFTKIAALPNVGLFHENKTLNGEKCCAVLVVGDEIPNVLKFAKLWSPKND